MIQPHGHELCKLSATIPTMYPAGWVFCAIFRVVCIPTRLYWLTRSSYHGTSPTVSPTWGLKASVAFSVTTDATNFAEATGLDPKTNANISVLNKEPAWCAPTPCRHAPPDLLAPPILFYGHYLAGTTQCLNFHVIETVYCRWLPAYLAPAHRITRHESTASSRRHHKIATSLWHTIILWACHRQHYACLSGFPCLCSNQGNWSYGKGMPSAVGLCC